MKLFIASDIHGSVANTKRLFERLSGDYRLILLGDLYYHGPRNPFPEEYAPMAVADILNTCANLSALKGNCDSEVDEMISIFPLKGEYSENYNGKRLFFTHGHKHNPDMPLEDAKDGDVVFYGHFHTPKLTVVNGVRYVCVGSIALPKDSPRTYAEVADGVVRILSFEGDEILSFAL